MDVDGYPPFPGNGLCLYGAWLSTMWVILEGVLKESLSTELKFGSFSSNRGNSRLEKKGSPASDADALVARSKGEVVLYSERDVGEGKQGLADCISAGPFSIASIGEFVTGTLVVVCLVRLSIFPSVDDVLGAADMQPPGAASVDIDSLVVSLIGLGTRWHRSRAIADAECGSKRERPCSVKPRNCGRLLTGVASIESMGADPTGIELWATPPSRLMKLFLRLRRLRQLNSSSNCGSYGGRYSSFFLSDTGDKTTTSLEYRQAMAAVRD